MGLERRGRIRRSHDRSNWKQEDLDACDRQAVRSARLPDGSRVRRESHARFCERPVVQSAGLLTRVNSGCRLTQGSYTHPTVVEVASPFLSSLSDAKLKLQPTSKIARKCTQLSCAFSP